MQVKIPVVPLNNMMHTSQRTQINQPEDRGEELFLMVMQQDKEN